MDDDGKMDAWWAWRRQVATGSSFVHTVVPSNMGAMFTVLDG